MAIKADEKRVSTNRWRQSEAATSVRLRKLIFINEIKRGLSQRTRQSIKIQAEIADEGLRMSAQRTNNSDVNGTRLMMMMMMLPRLFRLQP